MIFKHFVKAKRTENDVELSISMDELPQANYSYLESEGIGEISSKVTSLFQNLGTDLCTDVRQMYNMFDFIHPKDDTLNQRNLLQGMWIRQSVHLDVIFWDRLGELGDVSIGMLKNELNELYIVSFAKNDMLQHLFLPELKPL